MTPKVIADEVRHVHLRAAELWQDEHLIKFLENYQTELYDAIMEFVLEPSALNMSYLDEAIEDSVILSGPIMALKKYITYIEDMRKALLR